MDSQDVMPQWITQDVLESAIRTMESDPTLQFRNMSTRLATAAGDNYSSIMIRVSIESLSEKFPEHQKNSYLIKLLCEGRGGVFFKKCGMWDREVAFYKEILPLFNKLLKEEHMSSYKSLAPQGIYVKVGENELILMKDLSPLGYGVGDRIAGMDLEHATMTVKNISHFHAMSAILAERNPGIFEIYSKHPFYTEEMECPFSLTLGALAIEVEYWPEHKYLKPKIEKLSQRIPELGTKAGIPKPGDFLVLNQGDLWTNNVLVKYSDEGSIEDIVFVDFQLIHYATPLVDLQYFFNISLQYYVYENHLDELLEIYHQTLCQDLKRMRFPGKPPTLEHLKEKMKETAFLGAFSGLCNFPVVRSHPSDGYRIDNRLFKEDNYPLRREKYVSREETAKVLKKISFSMKNKEFLIYNKIIYDKTS